MTLSKKELKNYLKDLTKKESGLSNFSFEYHSGHTSYHTRIKIFITSEKIEQLRIPRGTPVDATAEANATKAQQKEFSTDQLIDFVEELRNIKIWDLENCTDRALPDTGKLSFIIKDNDDLLFEENVWENCRNDDSRTKDLIRVISALIPADWSPP